MHIGTALVKKDMCHSSSPHAQYNGRVTDFYNSMLNHRPCWLPKCQCNN